MLRSARPLAALRSPALRARAPVCALARLCSSSAALTPASSAPPPLPPTRFAVVALAGTQYKVAVDDQICVERIEQPVGSTLSLRRVLMVGDVDATVIGSPVIEDAVVSATVEEQGFAKKVIAFKKRRRKGYKRWKGYRARLTLLRINAIDCAALDGDAAKTAG